MQLVLVMFRKDGQRRSFAIAKPAVTIGRREDCDLRIPLGEISRKHCKVSVDGDAARVEDLGSSNGTFVDGKRVQDSPLRAGQTLQVGPVAFVLQVNGSPPDDELRVVEAAKSPSGSDSFDPTSLLMGDLDDSGITPLPTEATLDLETKTRLPND